MVVGTTLFKLDGNDYYSPQFPRGGLAATFAVDVTHVANSPNFGIEVETKNSEDTSWTSLGTFTSITAVGTAQKDLTGAKEQLRFKYSFNAGDATDAAVHFLMQPPSWRPY